ncbi:DUF664 domain-containing protein [Rhodococcus sp. HNM0569]|uniref:mycothiol transferase n=1 Tax=Rhodococcus sp. HNM0569 TaxID=2716340 RepID=UPI003211CE9B
MDQAQLLSDGFGRIREVVGATLDGLPDDALTFRIDPDANTVAWLIWHLTRVQDDHVADAAGTEQVWTIDGWADRFALPFDRDETGFGQSSREVGLVRASADLLAGYHDAVCERTLAYVAGLDAGALDRVVDESWDPPVTLGVRLVSVLSDDLQHAGQAAFVAGAWSRSSGR